MFSLVSGVYEAYLAPTQLNILVVGASSVGKTTTLERIKVTQFASKSSRHKKDSDVPNVPTHWLKHSATSDGSAPEISSEKGKIAGGDTNAAAKASTTQLEKKTTKARKSSWFCPAPNRYADAALKSDGEEDIVEEGDDDTDDNGNGGADPATDWGYIPSPSPTRKVRNTSMESVDLMDNASKATYKIATCCVETNEQQLMEDYGESSEATDDLPHPTITENDATVLSSVPPAIVAAEAEIAQAEAAAALAMSKEQEYDLKPKAKMLPLAKIRRTIGMNLGKVNIQGVICNFWDLGGRMHELWERYYVDSDAVIFVWRTPSPSERDSNDGQDDDSDDVRGTRVDTALQQSLLEEVRSSIPDDVPFLVLGHIFADPDNPLAPIPLGGPKTDVLYSTTRLLPHYHNPYQALFFANAANGQGVRTAMEWLIPIAKRQLKLRESRPVEDEGSVDK